MCDVSIALRSTDMNRHRETLAPLLLYIHNKSVISFCINFFVDWLLDSVFPNENCNPKIETWTSGLPNNIFCSLKMCRPKFESGSNRSMASALHITISTTTRLLGVDILRAIISVTVVNDSFIAFL